MEVSPSQWAAVLELRRLSSALGRLKLEHCVLENATEPQLPGRSHRSFRYIHTRARAQLDLLMVSVRTISSPSTQAIVRSPSMAIVTLMWTSAPAVLARMVLLAPTRQRTFSFRTMRTSVPVLQGLRMGFAPTGLSASSQTNALCKKAAPVAA